MSVLDKFKMLHSKNFMVGLRLDGRYGFFEHVRLGDECGGGLWFENNGKELVDYDGVYDLPPEVRNLLINDGISVDE